MSWQTNGKGRLRRPAQLSDDNNVSSPQSSPTRRRDNDYHDDSDEEGVKGNKSHNQMYKGSCSLGRFCLNPCLCLATAAQRIFCRRQQGVSTTARKRPPMSPRREPFRRQGPSRGLLFMLLIVCMLMLWPRQSHRSLRHSSLDDTPILIKLFDYSDVNDIGGWHYPDGSKQFRSLSPLARAQSKTTNYGGLKFESLKNASPSEFRRTIAQDDHVSYEKYKKKLVKKMDEMFLSSDYDHLEERLDFKCRLPNFAELYFPNCNRFHEFDIARDHNPKRQSAAADLSYYDSYLFSHGFYRDAWMLKAPGPNSLEQSCVLKELRWRHPVSMKTFTGIQKDALVMERLTSSPRILSMYGHCSMSMIVQPISHEVEEYIVPGEGMANQKDLDKLQLKDVAPKNDYNVTEKLEMALAMAESLADMHGYEGGVIVHDDVQLCQWLRNEDNELILGDFNRAEVLEWNVKKKKYCKYRNGYVYGNYRSPEEIRDDDLDEQIDIYSFGNNIYGLLTGLWVFYENSDDEVVQEKVSKGQRAYIDDRYRNHSFVEGKLIDLMERCWIEDPSERVDIFEAVRFLREVMKEHKKQIKKKT